MAVIENVIDGPWQRDVNGDTTTRTYIVTNQASFDPDTLPGEIPVRGTQHPEASELRAIAITITPEANQPQQKRVRVQYATPTLENLPELGGQRIEMDTTIVEERTIEDINGARLSATYIGPSGIVTHLPSAVRTSVLATATITRMETTTEDQLLLRSIAYVGTVNDAAWFGWPAKTWRVDDLEVRRLTRNDSYRSVRTICTYNPETWRFLATYISRGAVPEDATEGNGFAFYDIRRATDFSTLPITVPTMV